MQLPGGMLLHDEEQRPGAGLDRRCGFRGGGESPLGGVLVERACCR
jgi:hypothetical protein